MARIRRSLHWAMIVTLFWFATPVHAHAALESSLPAEGSVGPAPSQLMLEFLRPVRLTSLVLTGGRDSLVPLWAISQREPAVTVARVVERFSAVATFIVPLLLLAGLALAGLVGVRGSTVNLPYGLLLVGRFAGFSTPMALAGANKWRLGPGLRSGDLRAGTRFRLSVGLEYLLIVLGLALTAILTTFHSIEA